MPNGIDLLIADHELVNQLFAEFAESGDGAVVGRIIDALKAHDEAEHAALYPMCVRVVDDAALTARCELAHSAVKRQMELVGGLEGRPLVEATEQLRELIARHVADEEQHLLPALAETASVDQLDKLGTQILQAKQRGG